MAPGSNSRSIRVRSLDGSASVLGTQSYTNPGGSGSVCAVSQKPSPVWKPRPVYGWSSGSAEASGNLCSRTVLFSSIRTIVNSLSGASLLTG